MVRPLQQCRKGAGIGIDPGKNDTTHARTIHDHTFCFGNIFQNYCTEAQGICLLTDPLAPHLEVTPGFEPGNEGFADPCLTTWLCHRMTERTEVLSVFGAGDEARTRYLDLGKVALYQMSYARKWCLRSELNQRHADFQSAALPTELQRHMATKMGLEPTTSSVTGWRSNQLNYLALFLVGTTGLEPVTPCL